MWPLFPAIYLGSANVTSIQNMPAGLRKAEVREIKLEVIPVQRRGKLKSRGNRWTSLKYLQLNLHYCNKSVVS